MKYTVTNIRKGNIRTGEIRIIECGSNFNIVIYPEEWAAIIEALDATDKDGTWHKHPEGRFTDDMGCKWDWHFAQEWMHFKSVDDYREFYCLLMDLTEAPGLTEVPGLDLEGKQGPSDAEIAEFDTQSEPVAETTTQRLAAAGARLEALGFTVRYVGERVSIAVEDAERIATQFEPKAGLK